MNGDSGDPPGQDTRGAGGKAQRERRSVLSGKSLTSALKTPIQKAGKLFHTPGKKAGQQPDGSGPSAAADGEAARQQQGAAQPTHAQEQQGTQRTAEQVSVFAAA